MRPIHALPVVLVVAALAGCGGGGGDSGSTDGGSSTSPPATTQAQPGSTSTSTQARRAPARRAAKGPDGAQVFASAGCTGCHTLAAANASGNVGPNLDDLQPDFATVQHQVENGGGGMPSFSGDLSQAQIDAVARYVSENAGR
jgi:mono/diheme cytochrome c family protein